MLIIGIDPGISGAICFFQNGEITDVIDIHPKNRKFKGGSPWGGISLDKKNNILFLTTGNPETL